MQIVMKFIFFYSYLHECFYFFITHAFLGLQIHISEEGNLYHSNNEIRAFVTIFTDFQRSLLYLFYKFDLIFNVL